MKTLKALLAICLLTFQIGKSGNANAALEVTTVGAVYS